MSASPTGDKKAEKFEDDFLDELFEYMESIGLRAVTYMPPRNTPEQLERIHALAATHGMLEISGVDINQPRQRFTCAAPSSRTSTRLPGPSSRTRPCPPWTPPCTCWAARVA